MQATRTNNFFRGNPNLRASYVNMDYTQEQITEIAKCYADPIYFIETYIKIVTLDHGLIPIKMWDFQKDLIKSYVENRFVVSKWPRQSSKTTTTMLYVIWKILFNPTFHVAILADKLSTARKILMKLQKMYESIPLWLQQGVLEWNKGSLELENNSRVMCSATTTNAMRGDSINLIIADEYAMVRNTMADEFMAAISPTISSGETTQIFILSTPKGLNHFYKIWQDAIAGINGFIAKNILWSQVPGRDAEWEKGERARLGRAFDQEHGTEFLGSSNTLIDSTTLRSLVVKEPIFESGDLKIYEYPKKQTLNELDSKDHSYVIVVDTSEGLGLDSSAFSVIDITDTPYKQVAVYQCNEISPTLYPQIILDCARKYNNAHVLIETNNVGSQVAEILWSDLEYENVLCSMRAKRKNGQTISFGHNKLAKLGIKTSAVVKSVGCSTLRTLMENKSLIVYDSDTFSEMTTFVQSGRSYSAEQGCNDDIVMGLVLFGWLTQQQYFKDLTDLSLKKRLYENNLKQIEESMLPSCYIDNGLSPQTEIDENGLVWETVNERTSEDMQFWDITENGDMLPDDYREMLNQRKLDYMKSQYNKN